MESTIKEYLGKYQDGVLVLITIKYEDIFYDGTFFYTEKDMVITVDEKLEKILGCKIKEYKEYIDFARGILQKIVPYNEIVNRLDPVDFTKWGI